jgi:hypothetical protein
MVISSLPIYEQFKLQYPSKVTKNRYGKCLVAKEDLGRGEVVQRYEGVILDCYADIPSNEICYVLAIGTNHYMIVRSDARFINHSCTPNCDIDQDYYVVTLEPLKKGEELTVCYNEIEPEHEGMTYFWDPRWSFTCHCGSPNCIGKIDKYTVYERPVNLTK